MTVRGSADTGTRERPSEEDERRALMWLTDARAHGGPLDRRYAATIIDTLAWFEVALAAGVGVPPDGDSGSAAESAARVVATGERLAVRLRMHVAMVRKDAKHPAAKCFMCVKALDEWTDALAGVGEARPAEPPPDDLERALTAAEKAIASGQRAVVGWQECAAEAGRLREQLDAARLALKKLDDERRLGPTPLRCLNAECTTIAVGTGYKKCPRCGGELTDAGAALGVEQ